MAERHQVRAHDSKPDGNAEEKKANQPSDDKDDSASDVFDDLDFSTPIIELDRKDLLIVKDGTVRVAESLDREQQQFDANGEVVKASGTWTKAEHERFLRAMETFPKGPWKAIAEMVATRTSVRPQTGGISSTRLPVRQRAHAHLSTGPSSWCYGLHGPSTARMVSAPMVSMAARTIPLARATSLPAMPIHRSSFHHHPTTYASTPMSASMAMVSSEFSQLSTSTISSAFVGNASYPASWDAETKPTVPDFDESMDFLMDVYSSNPNQINTVVTSQSSGLIVTPTACIPRTPQTPTPSSAMKRHPGYGFVQPHTKHFFVVLSFVSFTAGLS
ncbi:Myb-like domain [Phytophthora cactorum]|nr:Myb-like domain [Phytophthora cactorum]